MAHVEYTHPAEFDRIREELLGCTDQALGYVQELEAEAALKDCVREAKSRLGYSQTVMQRNVMPTSLMAESQAGKTTTVNAMLDGYNRMPRGSGAFRTSSVPLTIYHDPKKTKIEISLYTQEELVNRILEVAGRHLDVESGKVYHLDNQDDFMILYKAVEKEIQIYRQDSGSYSQERVDLLHNAILILHFYDCEAYQQLYNNEFTTLKSVKKFLSFRTDLETCWENLRTRGFELMNDRDENGRLLFGEMENLHVFVKDITIPVHSEFMQETGTAVIDAPGTKMSLEDTRRALKAASDAAVVLFIFKGERQLGVDDKEMLRTLRKAGLASKVLFAVNFRRPVEEIREVGIERAILSVIHEAGYDFPQHQQLLYYNARLAMLAAQGRLIFRGELDVDTTESIMQEAAKKRSFDTVEKAWKYLTARALRELDEDDLADELNENEICPEILQQLDKVSHWNETIQALRGFVLQNRASGVLNDLGARPVCETLTDIENKLEMYEKNAERSEEDAAAAYEAAKKKLNDYVEEVEQVIKDNLDESIDQAIAQDYFDNVILAVVPDVASAAARDIYRENGLMNNIRVLSAQAIEKAKKTLNKVYKWLQPDKGGLLPENTVESVKQRCSSIIKRALEKEITVKGTHWSTNLYESQVYKSRVEKAVKRVLNERKKLWEEYGFKKDELMQYANPQPVKITGNLQKDAVSYKQLYDMMSNNVNAKLNISPEASGYVAGLSVGVAGFVWYCFLMPLDFFIPFMGAILTVVSLAVMYIVQRLVQGSSEKQIEEIKKELEKSLRDEIVKNKEINIERIIEGNQKNPGVKSIRLFYEDLFKLMNDKHYVDLKEAYDRLLKILKESEVERKRIAKLAESWRTEKIEPLRSKVEAAISEVKRIWG